MDALLLPRLLLLFIFPAVSVGQTTSEDTDAFSFPPETCLTAPLASRLSEWQDDVTKSDVSVEWTYGNETCSSMNTCFGMSLKYDVSLEAQIRPINIQQGVTVKFFPSRKMDILFAIKPYIVDEIGFRSCDPGRGRPVIDQETDEEFIVSSNFLNVGNNYFIAKTSDPLYDCKFGLRINITVRSEACSGIGESVHCWDKGRCVADSLMPRYECTCCHGFAGPYCQDVDSCVSAPCQNAGTCSHTPGDVTGTQFVCSCPLGYYGTQCENRIDNLCETSPCENNATCSGNHSNYECYCPHGYSGHHCEVNENNCASGPCVHGVCVDKVGGYQCFCTPGFGGTSCNRQFDECQSNPCKNSGFCVDMDDSYECHCSQGYRGPECSIKVNLCSPNPCENATECVDFGHSYECTCNPGFTGAHCEVNINECASNPCMNDGKCRDVVSGYICICPKDVSGIHCEYMKMDLPRRPPAVPSYRDSGIRHLHINNLYIVAGTLAGALIIALSVLVGCYCRVHETYRKLYWWKNGYSHHKNDSLREKKRKSVRQVAEQFSDHRPSTDAILEASGSSYDDNNLNVPLVNSLRPKRV